MTKSHKNSKTRPKINVSAGLWRILLGDWGCEYNYDVICKDTSFFLHLLKKNTHNSIAVEEKISILLVMFIEFCKARLH